MCQDGYDHFLKTKNDRGAFNECIKHVFASGVKTGFFFHCFVLMHFRTILMLWVGWGGGWGRMNLDVDSKQKRMRLWKDVRCYVMGYGWR